MIARLALGLALLALAGLACADERAGLAEMRVAIAAERIAKLHAQLAAGVLPQRARRAMPQRVRELEALLAVARAQAATAERREHALLLAVLWRGARPWALKPPTPENHRHLAERVDEIAWVAWKGARLARPAGADAALEAARGAALAQRVARLHLERGWRGEAAGMGAEIAARSSELAALLDPARDPAGADPELAVARSQLEFLMRAARAPEQDAGAGDRWAFLAKSADHISEALERAALRAALGP